MPTIWIAIVCCLLPALAAAQQQLFRYIDRDGRVVYTDTAPPADARSVQQKKLGGNFIETSEAPYALQYAQQRNPVTLYAGPCGPICEQARALLNRRGVPFTEIDVSQPGEMPKFRQLTGDQQVPVLAIGSATLLRGFEEGGWQAALDQAAYPKTPAARITALKREADKAAADKIASKAAPKVSTRGDDKEAAKGEARPEAAAPEVRK